MQHISTTPFGRRPVTAGLLARQHLAEAPAPTDAPDKWAILKDLTAARAAFGVSDRDLAVLSALVSFHRAASLAEGDGTIVFPSNRALAERAHGMAESTLRRHLAALVGAGLILRHDSPNGKRYAVRDGHGGVDRAFGFDLRPLLVRAAEIAQAAREARESTERLRRLREAVVLRLRDVSKLISYGLQEGLAGDWQALQSQHADCQRQLRRKPQLADLSQMETGVKALAETARAMSSTRKTDKMSGNDIENERHIQYSNRIPLESEPCQEKQESPVDDREPSVPLQLVLKACPGISDYAPGGIRHWHELISTAELVRSCLGISPDAWQDSKREMGPATAAVVLAGILQKGDAVSRPGGYLRSLTRKAAMAAFSPGPMIMALLRTEDRVRGAS